MLNWDDLVRRLTARLEVLSRDERGLVLYAGGGLLLLRRADGSPPVGVAVAFVGPVGAFEPRALRRFGHLVPAGTLFTLGRALVVCRMVDLGGAGTTAEVEGRLAQAVRIAAVIRRLARRSRPAPVRVDAAFDPRDVFTAYVD